MNKEEIWKKFCEVNPSFNTEYSVNMSVDKLRKMIETAYKYAYDAGFERGKEITASLYKAAGMDNAGNNKFDMFGEIFNKKK